MCSYETEKCFIQLYRAEAVLWDPVVRLGMDKSAYNLAWARISKKMGVSVACLKLMKNKLYARFMYRLRRNQKISQRGEKFEIYNPDWFVKDYIDSFFGSLYQLRLGCKKASIKYPMKKISAPENCIPEKEEKSTDLVKEESCEETINEYLLPIKKHRRKSPPQRVRQSLEEISVNSLLNDEERTKNDSCVNSIDDSLIPINLTLKSHSSSSETSPSQSVFPVSRVPATNNETPTLSVEPYKAPKDDCDLYVALLGNKLRKLPEKDRLQLMHKIDSLLIGGTTPKETSLIKPYAPSFVQTCFPYLYPATSQFASYFQHSVVGCTNPQYSAFSVVPPK